jgi:hypothetical protein
LLFGLLPCLGAGLSACDPFAFGAQDALTARSSADTVQSAPHCAECHDYPLHDILHQFHLTTYVVNRDGLANPALNGAVTCMDCHFKSIRHVAFNLPESTWVDTNGNELSGHFSPSDQLHITLYRKYHPVPYVSGYEGGSRPDSVARALDTLILTEARFGRVVRWMTDMAHYDGIRQVAFAPNNVTDSAHLSTAYNPKEISCSAVACHNRAAVRYRWASPSRSLSGCPSLSGHDTTCGETVP